MRFYPSVTEKEASLTLRELEQLIVRFLVDQYNQSLDARMGDQTRYQRWEAGLRGQPELISERELDICLMKATEGYIGRLDEILREAAIKSLSLGHKRLEKAVLQEVAREYS